MININLKKIAQFFVNNATFVFAILFFVSLMTAISYRGQLIELKEDPQKIVGLETQKLINEVAKLVVLPDNEEPTIATVSDPELLKDQPFFAKAKKGFKVLIYASAGKSILYDPFDKRVVEVASININTEPETDSKESPSPTPAK